MGRVKWVFVQGGWEVFSALLFPAFKAVRSVTSEWMRGRRGKKQGDQAPVHLGSKLLGSASSRTSWQSSVSMEWPEMGSPRSRCKESAFGWHILCLLPPQKLQMHQWMTGRTKRRQAHSPCAKSFLDSCCVVLPPLSFKCLEKKCRPFQGDCDILLGTRPSPGWGVLKGEGNYHLH